MWAWAAAAAALIACAALVGARRARRRFRSLVAADHERLRGRPPATTRRSLPPLVAAFEARAGLESSAGRAFVRVVQQGEMRLAPGARWRPFRAVQTFAVASPEFVWQARLGVFEVVDAVVGGAGRLEVRAFGAVPVASASGPATTCAQLQRYLAEVAWVPGAIAHNAHLEWREAGPREAVGAVSVGATRAELRFSFDGRGDLSSVCGERGRQVGRDLVQTPWQGRFSDHREIGGLRVPRRAEVAWTLDGREFCYWRGVVTDLTCA